MTATTTAPSLDNIAEPLRRLAVPIDTLVLDPANARTHDEKNLAAIQGSLSRFGQRLPIVVQKQGLIVRAGNGRVIAAKALGWSHIAAVVVDESEVEATAYAIADNRSGELAAWDDESLAKLLQSLPEDAFAATGFSTEDLSELLDKLTPKVVSEDEPPEPPATPISRPGDLWLLGEHRLLCGDSTSAEDVAGLMDGAVADLVLTDPPYGVEYVGKTDEALTIENDGQGGLEDLLRASLALALDHTRPGAVWYVAAPAGPQFAAFALVLSGLGVWRQTLAWVKDSMVLGHSDYHYKHEAILYGWSPGAGHRPPPDRTRTSVLEFERPNVGPVVGNRGQRRPGRLARGHAGPQPLGALDVDLPPGLGVHAGPTGVLVAPPLLLGDLDGNHAARDLGRVRLAHLHLLLLHRHLLRSSVLKARRAVRWAIAAGAVPRAGAGSAARDPLDGLEHLVDHGVGGGDAVLAGSVDRLGHELHLGPAGLAVLIPGELVDLSGVPPPAQYRWKPGQSGNPSGKGQRESLTAMLRRVLEREHQGKPIGELLVERLVKEALSGKLPHIKEVLDRVEGKVKEKIEVEGAPAGCVVFQVPPRRVIGEPEGAPALAPLREGVEPAANPLVVRGECWKEV